MSQLPHIRSEELEPLFAHVIAIRFAMLRGREQRPMDAVIAKQIRITIDTLGDLARAAGATHAGLCCDNESRKLRLIELLNKETA